MLSPLNTSSREPARVDPLASSTATQKERAYSRIRKQIEGLELQRGAKVSTRELARVLGISTIPVREAVTQLVGEGLLEHRPGVGTFVMNPTRLEIKDIYELRMVLESYAARRAATAEDTRGLKEMRRSVELMSQLSRQPWDGRQTDSLRLHKQWGIADASFHLAVLHRARNHLAVKMVAGLRLMTRVFGHRLSELRMRNLEGSLQEHVEILGAIEDRDARSASILMRRHIRRGLLIAMDRDEESLRSQSMDTKNIHDELDGLAREITELEEYGI